MRDEVNTIPVKRRAGGTPISKSDRHELEVALFSWRVLLGLRHRFTFVQRKYAEIRHREYYETP